MYRSTITTADVAELAESAADALLADDVLTAGLSLADHELAHVLASPALAAELAEVRRPRAEPTTALTDGSARRIRDARIANRAARAAEQARDTHQLAVVADLAAFLDACGDAPGGWAA